MDDSGALPELWNRRIGRRDLLKGAGAALLLAACGSSSTPSGRGTGVSSGTDAANADAAGWLRVEGNRILRMGQPWRGRGVNMPDTRSCNACTKQPADLGEVLRRVDEAVDRWGANFIRLALESYGSDIDARSGIRLVQWRGVTQDPQYLADVAQIVRHATAKPNVYVLVALVTDPTLSVAGRGGQAVGGLPTEATVPIWQTLATTFAQDSHVLFGIANEPDAGPAGDAEIHAAMSRLVEVIRAAEKQAGAPQQHVITVQGRTKSRFLDYYLDHPITAGGGTNIAYESHAYAHAAEFAQVFGGVASRLPVIIGEFGPAGDPRFPVMTLEDARALMPAARQQGIPHLGWMFHMRCEPSMLVDHTDNGCGAGMPLDPTRWGQVMREGLAVPWT